jgi:hypothetical protein
MNDITKHLLKEYLPIVIAFILGVIVAWKGCGNPTTTTVIEKPQPVKVQYVDRWKTDTVRFVRTRIKYDTIHTENNTERIVLDTLFLIDTLKIVDTWLTEVVHYDTTVKDVRLQWQNYQNLTENLRIDYTPKVKVTKFALGVHGNIGVISDFKTQAVPMFGIGLQTTIKKTYIAADYGFNGQHYVGIRVGKNFLEK